MKDYLIQLIIKERKNSIKWESYVIKFVNFYVFIDV